MGVMLLGKMKIYELAKQLEKTSKEIIAVAQELGINAKTHMSSLEEGEVEILKKKLSRDKTTTSKNKKEEAKEAKKESPVIIRRQVIITDEEIKRKEEEERKKKQAKQNNNGIGFVERKNKNDYNIVYRNKQSKPMTVSELFGLKEPKKTENK